MTNETPGELPALSADAEKSLDDMMAAHKARLKKEADMREQEKQCLKDLKARVNACTTEAEFLSTMKELEQESTKIKDTVMVSSLEVKFGDKEYDVILTVKPRRTVEHVDEPIEFMVWYTKAI